jgi:hypothetical protein
MTIRIGDMADAAGFGSAPGDQAVLKAKLPLEKGA